MMSAPAPTTRPPADGWIRAAAAVRHAVLTTAGVAGLSESAAFQTHGRGPAVRGVALRASDRGPVRLDVGVVVEAAVASDPDRLAGLARFVRSAAEAAWVRAGVRSASGRAVPVEVAVHLVDVADREPASGSV